MAWGDPQDGRQELREENRRLRARLDQANARIETLVREVGRLADQVARGNERVVELLAVAQRKQRARTSRTASEDLPAPEPPVELDGDAKARFDNRPKPPKRPEKKAKPKKKPRPTGRKAVPDHLETERHECAPDACGRCGSHALDAAGEVVEYLFSGLTAGAGFGAQAQLSAAMGRPRSGRTIGSVA